jgi:hypothetical protein
MKSEFPKLYKQQHLDLLDEDEVNYIIKENKLETNKISDGYHTFGELYECRKLLNAALFNEWELRGLYNVHKSLRHHDGQLCFGGGWFIVVAELPDGQMSFHYEEKDWSLFEIAVADKMRVPFDGHTTRDVLDRLKSL